MIFVVTRNNPLSHPAALVETGAAQETKLEVEVVAARRAREAATALEKVNKLKGNKGTKAERRVRHKKRKEHKLERKQVEGGKKGQRKKSARKNKTRQKASGRKKFKTTTSRKKTQRKKKNIKKGSEQKVSKNDKEKKTKRKNGKKKNAAKRRQSRKRNQKQILYEGKATCNGTSLGDSCLTNLIEALKYERDKISTFYNQKSRAATFNKVISAKGSKNATFDNTTTYLLLALGGNASSLNCSGKTSMTSEASTAYK